MLLYPRFRDNKARAQCHTAGAAWRHLPTWDTGGQKLPDLEVPLLGALQPNNHLQKHPIPAHDALSLQGAG